jgi:deoxyribose-phosphate aldolase
VRSVTRPWRHSLIELAGKLEHILLRPDITPGEVDDACAAAVEAGLAAVTVWPSAVASAVAASDGSRVEVVAAVGGPSGAALGDSELHQTRRAIAAGARHVAVAIDAARLREGDAGALAAELADTCRLAHAAGVHVRAVLQAHLLDEGGLAAAARLAAGAGADLLQTGFGVEAPASSDQVLAARRALPRRPRRVGVIAGGAEDAHAVRDLLERGGALRVAVLDPAGVLGGVAV